MFHSMDKFKISFILLLCLSIFLLFFRLGSTTLTNWDEAWFAAVAQDILQRGDVIGGMWNGQMWFYEPPMVTTFLAGIMKFLGMKEGFLRLFSAVCGLSLIMVTYFLTRLLTRDHLASVLASLILLSDIEFLFRSRQIATDIPLTLFLLLSLTLWIYASRKQQLRWFYWGMFSWGLAFLTKRASPFLLAPACLAWILGVRRQLNLSKIFLGIGCVALAILPWIAAMSLRFGTEFWRMFVWGYTIRKIASVNPTTGSNSLFYLQALQHAFKIWVLLLPMAGLWILRTWRKFADSVVLITYIVTFLMFLSLASIKASWYLLPVHPVLAIIMAAFLSHFIHRTRRWQFFLMVGVCAVVGVQILHWQHEFLVPETTRHQAVMARLAQNLTNPGETIYLDDDYLPVAAFYSRRRVVPLRFNRLALERKQLSLPANHYVLTNQANVSALTIFSPNYELVAHTADLQLLKLLSP